MYMGNICSLIEGSCGRVIFMISGGETDANAPTNIGGQVIHPR